MRLKGTPGHVIQVRVKKFGGVSTIVPICIIGEDGYAEVDETKLSATDVSKLKALFGCDELHVTKKEITDEEVRELAKKNKIKSWHVKSIETLREELGV